MSWNHIVATVLLIAGGVVLLLAVLGLCVVRSAYDRVHYVGLAGFGALLVGASVMFQESFSLIGDKALLVGAMVAVSGPVLAHTTLRSLLIRERGDWRAVIDEVREDEQP